MTTKIQNKKIEIGFNIELKPIIKKELENDLKDFEIINKEVLRE